MFKAELKFRIIARRDGRVEYTTLGRSGLKVSRACLGALNFGTTGGGFGGGLVACDEDEAVRIVGAFLDAGNNVIDTADNYNAGQSEEVVGKAVRGRRDEVVIATKAGMPHGAAPNGRGLSRGHLTRALDASLRRLGTDYVDLYQCHLPDGSTPIEETMATLEGFVRAGKVRYLGCSNFSAAMIVEAQWAASRHGGTAFVALQAQYSLLQREIEAEILPACARHGLGTLAYSPLGGGVLAGRYRRGAEPEPDSRIGRLLAMPEPAAHRSAEEMFNERALDIADEVGKVAAEIDATPAAVALSWLLGRPGVTSVIIGPRSLDQYARSALGFELELPAELVARLDAVSAPGNLPVTGAPVLERWRSAGG